MVSARTRRKIGLLAAGLVVAILLVVAVGSGDPAASNAPSEADDVSEQSWPAISELWPDDEWLPPPGLSEDELKEWLEAKIVETGGPPGPYIPPEDATVLIPPCTSLGEPASEPPSGPYEPGDPVTVCDARSFVEGTHEWPPPGVPEGSAPSRPAPDPFAD